MMPQALRWFATGMVVVVIGLAPGMAGMAVEEEGKHSMSGTISALGHTTAMLTLKTGAGELKLHFPPPAIQKLKDGETITVHLSSSVSGAESGSRR
jgi:hypothetical protein